jgi:hypothetical protein
MQTQDTFAQRFLKMMAGWETQCPMHHTIITNISKFGKSHCKSVNMRKDSITQQFHVLQQLSVQVLHANIFCAKPTRKMSFFQYENIEWDSNLAQFLVCSLYKK